MSTDALFSATDTPVVEHLVSMLASDIPPGDRDRLAVVLIATPAKEGVWSLKIGEAARYAPGAPASEAVDPGRSQRKYFKVVGPVPGRCGEACVEVRHRLVECSAVPAFSSAVGPAPEKGSSARLIAVHGYPARLAVDRGGWLALFSATPSGVRSLGRWWLGDAPSS